jgi:hypothetical protein
MTEPTLFPSDKQNEPEQAAPAAEPAAEPKKRGRGRPVEKSDGSTKRILDAYRVGFIRRWNKAVMSEFAGFDTTTQAGVEEFLAFAERLQGCAKPMMQWGRDGKFAKQMIATWGEEVVVNLLATFFETTDQRVTRTVYSFQDFYNTAQYLMIRDRKPSVASDPRTASNLDAANRAMGRR